MVVKKTVPPRHLIYWGAAALLTAAALAGAPLDTPAAETAAAATFILGGLPHGAYDIALVRQGLLLKRGALATVIAPYAGLAVLMALLWTAAPLTALVLFLLIAATHFGEDWTMLDDPLLRFAAGFAVIAAATLGHPAAVTALFVAMSDGRGVVVARVAMAVAPVSLLVTAVGVKIAWEQGERGWAAAMASCFALMFVLPPVIGFALFFVFLHSPRHLAHARAALWTMSTPRWLATGALVSGAAILGWIALRDVGHSWRTPHVAAEAFQLLAAVATPHLILSHWLHRRLNAAGRPVGVDQAACPAG